MALRTYSYVGGMTLLVLASLVAGALVCKVIHESGHALTALVLRGRIESVRVSLPRSPGFFRIRYSLPGDGWRHGLTDLMGTGATTILAYVLVLIALKARPALGIRLAILSVSFACAWDMFLYATLPLFGLRRFLILGGRHAEPVCGAELMGIPRWLFLCGLTLSFLVFHGLLYGALRRHT